MPPPTRYFLSLTFALWIWSQSSHSLHLRHQLHANQLTIKLGTRAYLLCLLCEIETIYFVEQRYDCWLQMERTLVHKPHDISLSNWSSLYCDLYTLFSNWHRKEWNAKMSRWERGKTKGFLESEMRPKNEESAFLSQATLQILRLLLVHIRYLR